MKIRANLKQAIDAEDVTVKKKWVCCYNKW